MQIVAQSLSYLFSEPKDALFFYDTLYFEPYALWFGNDTLEYVGYIATGSQADVIKVYDPIESDSYALKIFFKTDNVIKKTLCI